MVEDRPMRAFLAAVVATCLAGSAGAQQSVLITPRVQLEVQKRLGGIETPPAVVTAPVPQVAPPQVFYVQPQEPPQQRPDMMRLYIFNQMMFNAQYQRRGVFFPRYVRRPDAGMRQLMIYHMWQNQR